MFRRFLMAFACLLSAVGLTSAAQATVFGFGFAIDFQNGDGAIGVGHLFTTDNNDGTFTVTGADGQAAYLNLSTFDVYDQVAITGAGPSFFVDPASVPTITFANGVYSFDNLQLFGEGRFYDFSHFFGPDLIGISGEVGGPAQFQFGIDDSGVPEAATWMLMLVGFGATGAAMRRRRSPVIFA
jgi:hypothetical protein